MAEGSMHTWDSDGADDSRLSWSSWTFYNIISHQDDLEFSDIVQPCQFETLEIESDTGSHHSAIDHGWNNEGER